MKIFIIFYFIVFSINLFSIPIADSITLKKIEKLVQKEEDIAKAYKEYLLKYGKNPANIKDLIDNNFLPKGFYEKNPFDKEIKFVDGKNQIEKFTTTDPKLLSHLKKFYFVNTNRKFTSSIENNDIEILLSPKEKFIFNNMSEITTSMPLSTENKYHLTNGILNFYEQGKYKFSIANDILVSKDVNIIDGNGNIHSDFKTLILDKNITFAGQKIFGEESNLFKEYLNTQTKAILLSKKVFINKILMKFSPSSAGVIINGDIYTWGNNSKKTISVGTNSYTKDAAVVGTGTAIINTMVRAKALYYDNDLLNLTPEKNILNTENLYSSSLRTKFINLYVDNNKSICAISEKNELFCGGEDVLENNYISFIGYLKDNDNTNNKKMDYLYKSAFFDNTNPANDVLFINNTYLVASEKGLYYWGKDNINGFAGTGLNTEKNVFSPTKSSDLIFINLFFNPSLNKIIALSKTGDLYIWGLTSGQDCNTTQLCKPKKLVEIGYVKELELKGREIVVWDADDKPYRVIQNANSTFLKKLVQEDINFVSVLEDDKTILSFDYIQNSSTNQSDILWVNSKNQLKGNLNFNGTADEKKLFDYAINQISWEKVKIIGRNAICALDTNKQMYCWGDLSNTNNDGFLIPIFGSNLQDINKDYIFLEKSGTAITTVTSGDWIKDSKYFIKYPTFIGGFNYDVIFK